MATPLVASCTPGPCPSCSCRVGSTGPVPFPFPFWPRRFQKKDDNIGARLSVWLQAVDDFSLMDTDGSGEIDVQEFKIGLSGFGVDRPAQLVQQMLVRADVDGSGKLSLVEFAAFVADLAG